MAINTQNIIEHSQHNGSAFPVTTARYLVEFVMNEEQPHLSDEEHRQAFAAEIQRVMDEAHFTLTLRYDAIDFDVLVRTVLDVAPANEPIVEVQQ